MLPPIQSTNITAIPSPYKEPSLRQSKITPLNDNDRKLGQDSISKPLVLFPDNDGYINTDEDEDMNHIKTKYIDLKQEYIQLNLKHGLHSTVNDAKNE